MEISLFADDKGCVTIHDVDRAEVDKLIPGIQWECVLKRWDMANIKVGEATIRFYAKEKE
jgi:hypothetical protein